MDRKSLELSEIIENDSIKESKFSDISPCGSIRVKCPNIFNSRNQSNNSRGRSGREEVKEEVMEEIKEEVYHEEPLNNPS